MEQLRPIGTIFTEHSFSYSTHNADYCSIYDDIRENEKEYQIKFKIIAHHKDILGRTCEVIEPIE